MLRNEHYDDIVSEERDTDGASNNNQFEEISDDYLQRMEDELNAHQQQVNAARSKLIEKKKLEWKSKANVLQERLDSLDNNVSDNRKRRIELRTDLAKKKLDRKAVIRESLAHHDETWDLERGHELEEAARLKIEMEKIREKRLLMEKMLDTYTIHLDEVTLEKKRRGATDAEKLANLLNRGSDLEHEIKSGALDITLVSQKMLASEAGKQQEQQLTEEPYRLVDEIEAVRKRKHDSIQLERARAVRDLNDARAEILEKEEKLLKEKQQLQMLVEKGPEFLADLEFGDAPPKDFVLRNLQAAVVEEESDEQAMERLLNELENDETIEDTIEAVKTFIEKKDEVALSLTKGLEQIEDEKTYGVVEDFTYDSFTSYTAEQLPIKLMCESLTVEMIDFAVTTSESKTPMSQLLIEEALWKVSASALDTEHQEKKRKVAIHRVGEDLTLEVIRELISDTWYEIEHAEFLATSFVNNAMLNLFFINQSNREKLKPREDMILEAFKEMKSRRRIDNQKKIEEGNDVELHQLRHVCVKSVANLPSSKDQRKSKKQQQLAPEDPSIPSIKEIGLHHTDVTPDDELRVRDIEKEMKDRREALDKRAHLERLYWKSCTITPHILKYPFNVSKCSVTALSHSALLLAGGGVNGEIYIWDLSHDPATLLRRVPSMPKADRHPYKSIEWSLDDSAVLTLNSANTVVVYTLLPNAATYTGVLRHSSSMLPTSSGHYIPPTVYPQLRIQGPDLERPIYYGLEDPKDKKKRLAAEKNLKRKTKNASSVQPGRDPVIATFSPSLSLTGHQSSIVVGSSNGTVMKYNNQHANREYHFVHGAPVGFFAPPKNNDDDSPFAVRPRSIAREFFHGHHDEVLYIGFASKLSMDMITVCKAGIICVWTYEKEYFTGYAWFKPSRKFRLDTRVRDQDDQIVKGTIEQVQNNYISKELVFMIFYPPPNKKQKPSLRFFVLNLLSFTLNPITFKIDVRGDLVNRFVISHMFHGIHSDFVLLLMNNTIYFISLATGKQVAKPIYLIGKNHVPHPVTSIATSSTQSHCMISAVGDAHEKIYLFEVQDTNSEKMTNKAHRSIVASPRYSQTPTQVMVAPKE